MGVNMKMLGEVLKKIVNVDLKLYDAPVMQNFGQLDEYTKPTRKELERVERRKLHGKH